MVVDRGEVEVDLRMAQARRRELVAQLVLDLALRLNALVIGEGVHLVDEDLEDDLRVDAMSGYNGLL